MAEHTPGPLSITQRGEGQFRIESDHAHVPGHWNDIYVEFSGFFGSYGPEVFAAAPELRDALRELLDSFTAQYPRYESGLAAQNAWGNRQTVAKENAVALLSKIAAPAMYDDDNAALMNERDVEAMRRSGL